MARYDAYDRGDNPLRLDLDVLDMPKRAADKARPKVTAKAEPKKKVKPAERYAGTKPQRPAESDPKVTWPLFPPEASFPAKIPEMNTQLDERNIGPQVEMGTPTSHPNIQGGLLQSMPLRSPAEQLQPVGPAAPSPLPFSNSPAGNPALQPTQTTGADQMGAALMNYLRSQLFNQGRPVQ